MLIFEILMYVISLVSRWIINLGAEPELNKFIVKALLVRADKCQPQIESLSDKNIGTA